MVINHCFFFDGKPIFRETQPSKSHGFRRIFTLEDLAKNLVQLAVWSHKPSSSDRYHMVLQFQHQPLDIHRFRLGSPNIKALGLPISKQHTSENAKSVLHPPLTIQVNPVHRLGRFLSFPGFWRDQKIRTIMNHSKPPFFWSQTDLNQTDLDQPSSWKSLGCRAGDQHHEGNPNGEDLK